MSTGVVPTPMALSTNESFYRNYQELGKAKLEYVVENTSFGGAFAPPCPPPGAATAPRLTGGLQKLDFPPFPVFFKLSHTPELSWEILN